jgi:hypothetical protein
MNSQTNWPKMRNGCIQAAWDLENPKSSKRKHTHQLLASQKMATLIRRLAEAASPDIRPPGPIFSNPVYPEYLARLKQGVDYESPYAVDDLTQEERDTLHKRSTTLYSILKTAQEASFMSIVNDPEFNGRELRHSVGWRNPKTLNAAGSVILIASATPNAAALQAERTMAKEVARREAKRKAGQTATSASQPAQTTEGSAQPSDSQGLPRQDVASASSRQPRDVTHGQTSPEAASASQGFYTAWPTSLEPLVPPSTSGRYQPLVSQGRAPELAHPRPRSHKRPASSLNAHGEQDRPYDPRQFNGVPNPLAINPTFRGFDGQRPTSADISAANPLVTTNASQQQPTLLSSHVQPTEHPSASAHGVDHKQSLGPEAAQTGHWIDHSAQPACRQASKADLATPFESASQVDFGEDEYHRIAHYPPSIPQTAHSQAGRYGHPALFPFPHLNPATTVPVSSYEGEEPARYAKSINSGTGFRFVDPNTINPTQLTRRIDPTPHPSQAHLSGSEAPWTSPSTNWPSVTRQHAVPAADPNLGRPVPSLHDHLLAPLVHIDALGNRRMTGDQYFGSQNRIRGPRMGERGERDR